MSFNYASQQGDTNLAYVTVFDDYTCTYVRTVSDTDLHTYSVHSLQYTCCVQPLLHIYIQCSVLYLHTMFSMYYLCAYTYTVFSIISMYIQSSVSCLRMYVHAVFTVSNPHAVFSVSYLYTYVQSSVCHVYMHTMLSFMSTYCVQRIISTCYAQCLIYVRMYIHCSVSCLRT